MQPELRIHKYGTGADQRKRKVLSSVPLNAAAASRTFTVQVSGYSLLRVLVVLDRTAATDLQLAGSGSLDDGDTFGRVVATSVTAGTGTNTDYTDAKAVSGDDTLLVTYDVRGLDVFRGVVSGTDGGASDLVDVSVTAVAGS